MMETIGVVAHEERHDEPQATSPSWFIAKLNPVVSSELFCYACRCSYHWTSSPPLRHC